MKEKKKKDISFKVAAANNWYAVRTIWSISPKRIFMSMAESMIGYGTWVFFSAFFIRYVINAIESDQPVSQILTYIAIVAAVIGSLTLLATYIRNVARPLNDIEVYQALYERLYRKAENVELACYENSEFYNKYTMALDDAGTKMLTIVSKVFDVFFAACGGVVAYAAMFSIDRIILVFIIAPLLGNFVFGNLVNKLSFRMYKEQTPYTRKTEYVNRVMYLSEYSKEIRLSNIYHVLKRIYTEAVEGIVHVVKKYWKKNILFGFGQFYFSYTIIFEGILLYGSYCALVTKTIRLGDLAILASVMTTAAWILVNLGYGLMDCSRFGMFIHNLRTFLEYDEVIPEDYEGEIPEKEIESIEFRNVSFSYQEGKVVIKNLSFTIKKGESIALVGHNGAGKSTIIKLLFRLYDPTEGEVLVNGKNIKEYQLKAYRALFGAAFQDYKILSASVKENVLMGRETRQADEVVKNALMRAGIYEKVMSLPNGMDTILTKEFDDDGEVLSGGQFQKIVVARAFANPAPIKVFDEPSSALDPIAEYELFESILEESEKNTMIFISHRLSSVKNADEVYMLEEGQMIERGTHKELMKQGGKYADMFDKQAKNYQPEEGEVAFQ